MRYSAFYPPAGWRSAFLELPRRKVSGGKIRGITNIVDAVTSTGNQIKAIYSHDRLKWTEIRNGKKLERDDQIVKWWKYQEAQQ